MTALVTEARGDADAVNGRRAMLVGLGVAAAALVHDGDATAAAPKRAALLVVVLALVALSRGEVRRLPAAGAAWLGFVAWLGCTLAWGSSNGSADLVGLTAALALLLAALPLPISSVREATRVAAVACGAGASLWATGEWLAGARGVWITGGQGNPDWLATSIAVALPCSLDWVRGRAARRWPVLVAEAMGLACARSRTACIATAIVLFVMLVEPRRRAGWLRAALVAAGVGAAALVGSGHALAGRAWIWRWSWAVGLRHLLLGCGLGSFGTAFATEQAPALRALSRAAAEQRFVLTPSAHNDWLQALAEGGLPALALLAMVLSLGVRAQVRAGWRAGAATLVAIGVAALAESPLRQPAVLALLALVLAACPSAPPPMGAGPRGWMVPMRSLAPGAIAAAALACAVPWWWAERLVSEARRVDPAARVVLVARAAVLDGGSPAVAFEEGLAALSAGDARSAIACFERARRGRWQVAYDIALGNAWLLAGDATAAAETYQHALALAPGSVRARLSLAEAWRRQGRLEAAARILAEVRHQRPGSAGVRALSARLDEDDL